MLNIILLVLGKFLEPISVMIVTMPILIKVAQMIQMDMVQFGVMVTLNVVIGMVTPPVGVCLFVVCAIAGKSIIEVSKEVLPMFFICLALLALVATVPAITLWLPGFSLFKHQLCERVSIRAARKATRVTDSKSLSGKVALITGASRGIGATIARRFAAAGSHVAIGYQARGDAAASLAAEITKAGGQCITVQGDITDGDTVQRIAADTVARFGRIDILVNCAGIAPYRPLGEMDAAYIRAMFDANVLGTILITQAVLPHLTAPHGRILNFASALAFRPIPRSSVYSASKGAIVTLTHAWAKELGPKGITVNAIAPGVIETEMTAEIIAERGASVIAATPLGRIGQPDDIAGIALFLCSPDAGWLTGRTIIADGGVT